MRVKLGDVCEKKIDAIKANYKGMIDYIDIASVDNQQKIITDTKQMTIENAPSRAKQLVFPGDILVSMVRPNLNAVALVPKISNNVLVASTGYCVLRCLPSVDTKYVFYFCQSSAFVDELVRQATGASYPAVTANIVRDCFIPLPSLDAQRHIAAILDKVTDLIAKRQAQLDKLDELVKSRFVEMFGDLTINNKNWHFEPLAALCDVRDGTHDSPQYTDTGYPILTSKNFTSGNIDFTNCNMISKEDFDKINQRSKVDIGDIILPMIGTIGSPVIVNTETPFAIKNVALIKFQHTKISNVFIKEILCSDYFQTSTMAANRGGTQKFIALGDIRKLPIPVVSLDLQTQFNLFVKQKESVSQVLMKDLAHLEVLKKSLMQQFFE